MSADAVLPGGPAPALDGATAFCDASALGDAASVLDGTVPLLGGTAPVLGGTGPVLGGTGWSTVAMARGPALRPMQCSVIELLFNLWLAYGKLVTSFRCCSAAVCYSYFLLSSKAWHYLLSAMHAYVDMLMRFLSRMTQALSV